MRVSYFFYVLVSLLILLSCKTDEQLKQDAAALAKKRLETIDYSTVDHYPLFADCDEMNNTAKCFFEQLHKVVAARLTPVATELAVSKHDTILVSMVVEANGVLRYEKLLKTPTTLQAARVDSLLQARLQYLPRLSSAIKQDVPVKTSYQLPIVLMPQDSVSVAPGDPSTARE